MKRAATQSSKNQTTISLSSWWGKGDTRDLREGRDRAAKMIPGINNDKREKQTSLKPTKIEYRVTQPMQRCRVRGYHRLGRKQGNIKEQRLGLRKYWFHFSPPDNAP